jgi:hypothetical protein
MKKMAVLLWLVAANVHAQASIDEFLNGVVGKPLFLKVDVLRVQRLLGGQDATNIDRDGQVYYRANVAGWRAVHTTAPREFAAEVRMQAREHDQKDVSVRTWNRGTAATVTKAKAEKDEIELDLRMTEGSSKIRFKLEGHYDLADVKRLFHAAFAETEGELQGSDTTVEIHAGMSPDEVIAVKGNPKTRVNLGAKTVFTYSDMKLVFEDGKLVDVQ